MVQELKEGDIYIIESETNGRLNQIAILEVTEKCYLVQWDGGVKHYYKKTAFTDKGKFLSNGVSHDIIEKIKTTPVPR